MTQCKIIGLTGGIATGKSTVSKIIGEEYTVIDADKIAKDIVEVNMKGYNSLVRTYGSEILDDNNQIDRGKLANIIFNSKKEREKVNSILHPIIISEMKDLIERKIHENYLFLDIPLLIEGLDNLVDNGIIFDEIWLVYSDENIQIERLMERDNIDREFAIKKINTQMNLDKKKAFANKIIYNNGSLDELRKNIIDIISELN